MQSWKWKCSGWDRNRLQSHSKDTWYVHILLMEKYKQLVQQLYIEPKNEEILGSYLQANETIDGVEAQQVWKKAKVKRKKPIKQLTDKKRYTIFLSLEKTTSHNNR